MEKLIYLDNAATTLRKPPGVAEAVAQAILTAGNAARGAHGASMQASRTVYETRQKLARLLGCPRPDHVVFTSNSTIALNIPRFITDPDKNINFVTGFAPYPVVEKGQTNYHSGVNYFSFAGITQGCQDEEAAWAFLKWYSTYGSKYLVVAGHQSTWIGTDPAGAVDLIFGSEEAAAKLIDLESFKKHWSAMHLLRLHCWYSLR